MNKLILFLSVFTFLSLASSCSKDENYDIQINSVNAESHEGAIMLRWSIPEDPNFLFVRIEYYNIRQKKEVICTKSIYADSLLVDGILARDGEYHFRLTAVNESGVASDLGTEVSCTALPVQPIETREETLLDNVEIIDYHTNAQEPSEGPIENLFDGNNNTFFHTAWSISIPYPQYVQIELSEAVNGAKVVTINRSNGGGGRPDHVEILGSNDQQTWEKIYEFYGSVDIPNTAGGRYESPMIDSDNKMYKYIRYNVLSGNGGNGYWNMAEMQWRFYSVTETIYDPENDQD